MDAAVRVAPLGFLDTTAISWHETVLGGQEGWDLAENGAIHNDSVPREAVAAKR